MRPGQGGEVAGASAHGDKRDESEACVEPLKVAYVMSRFPKLSETFVLYEILAVERRARASSSTRSFVSGRTSSIRRRSGSLRGPATSRSSPGAIAAQPASLPPARAAGLPRRSLGCFSAARGERQLLRRWPRDLPQGRARRAARWRPRASTTCTATSLTTPPLAGFVIHRLTGIPYSFTAHGSDLHVDRHMLCEKVARGGVRRADLASTTGI